MSEEFPKYRLVLYQHEENYSDWAAKLNALAEVGYRVHTIDMETGVALLSLKSDSKYDNIKGLVDVAPHEVNTMLEEGWIVAESWSKNVRMVKHET